MSQLLTGMLPWPSEHKKFSPRNFGANLPNNTESNSTRTLIDVETANLTSQRPELVRNHLKTETTTLQGQKWGRETATARLLAASLSVAKVQRRVNDPATIRVFIFLVNVLFNYFIVLHRPVLTRTFIQCNYMQIARRCISVSLTSHAPKLLPFEPGLVIQQNCLKSTQLKYVFQTCHKFGVAYRIRLQLLNASEYFRSLQLGGLPLWSSGQSSWLQNTDV
jgi:hypothetical protein